MFLIDATDVNEVAVVLRREIEHAGGMQSSLTDQAPLLGDVVIAVDGVIEQGDAFDDELAVVGDAAADVPARMVEIRILGKQVILDVEHYVHRLENDAFSPILSEWDLSDIAVAETQLEVPVEITIAQREHGIELLKVVACETTVEVTVFDIGEVPIARSISANLVGQVKAVFARTSQIAHVQAVAAV